MVRNPLCLSLVLLLPLAAAAQPAPGEGTAEATTEEPDEAVREQAVQHFQSGVALMQTENWDAAMLEFERSLELYPSRNALFNLGMCQMALFRYVAATGTFERFLELYREMPEAAAQVQRVGDALQDLRGLRATIAIDVNVAGAEILIDGRSVGTAPLVDPVIVDPGRHTVEARLDGYGGAPQIVPVTSGETAEVHVALAEIARIGRVRVEANVPDAEVWVDNALLGTVPFRGDLGEGEYTIEVRAAGYETQTQTVAVATGDERIVTVSLTRPGGTDPAWFWSMVGLTGAAAVATAALGAVVLIRTRTTRRTPPRRGWTRAIVSSWPPMSASASPSPPPSPAPSSPSPPTGATKRRPPVRTRSRSPHPGRLGRRRRLFLVGRF